jgi:predicted transcriptional regulator
MQVRKKKVLDGIDKEILRTLYEKRPLVSREIAKSVGLTAGAIAPRLNNLKKKRILKIKGTEGLRTFKRSFNGKVKLIKSPRSILWDLDLVQKKLK